MQRGQLQEDRLDCPQPVGILPACSPARFWLKPHSACYVIINVIERRALYHEKMNLEHHECSHIKSHARTHARMRRSPAVTLRGLRLVGLVTRGNGPLAGDRQKVCRQERDQDTDVTGVAEEAPCGDAAPEGEHLQIVEGQRREGVEQAGVVACSRW